MTRRPNRLRTPTMKTWTADTASLDSLMRVKAEVESEIIHRAMQLAADYGQWRALRGETSPEKLAALQSWGLDPAADEVQP
jgi:hypothetical protein